MKKSNMEELAQQLIANYMMDYQKQIGKSEGEANGSFVFLDHQTLQMILTYMFAQMGQAQSVTYDTAELESKMDHVMVQQKKQLEEIILALEGKV
ncbi:hypothetical protein [Gracilibacillus xinjiangensis]|uniref:Uncharacterized protein n=1 Tax=Gracilibacillus xinjiangensis TaxID=1193282 RepID=A0ABV8WVZ7_9BACI